MQFIRKRVLAGEVMLGIGANLGSGLTVEIIGAAGFDWIWIDCEHGTGDYSELIPQMQAAGIYNTPAIVRIAWNEAPRFKRVLDLSVNLGRVDNYEHPQFLQAMDRVAAACRKNGKAAGILVPKLDFLKSWIAKGFTFLVVGSDGGCVAGGLKSIADTCSQFK